MVPAKIGSVPVSSGYISLETNQAVDIRIQVGVTHVKKAGPSGEMCLLKIMLDTPFCAIRNELKCGRVPSLNDTPSFHQVCLYTCVER